MSFKRKDIDRHGRPKISVMQCTSATCQGTEIGCGNGDCSTSTHHKKSRKWRFWTIERFRAIFDREPRGFSNVDFSIKNKSNKK